MADHLIRLLDHLQVLPRMTCLTSGLLAALLAQTLGLPLEAIGGGRQMAIVTVFRQACVQVFDLGGEKGNLLALPVDQVLLIAYVLPQLGILLSQLGFFGRHGSTVVAFSSSGKPSRTPE